MKKLFFGNNNNEKKKQQWKEKQQREKTLKKNIEKIRHLPYMGDDVATCFQRYLYLNKININLEK